MYRTVYKQYFLVPFPFYPALVTRLTPGHQNRDDGHDDPSQDRRVGVYVRRRGGIGAGVLLPAATPSVHDSRHRAAARSHQRVGVALLLDVSLRHAVRGFFCSLTYKFKRTTTNAHRGPLLTYVVTGADRRFREPKRSLQYGL